MARLLAIAAATAACAAVGYADTTIAAGDPDYVKLLGRTVIDPVTKAVTFDWEGTSWAFTVANASYVIAELEDTTPAGTRFTLFVDQPGAYPHLRVLDFLTTPTQRNYTIARGWTISGKTMTFTLENLIEPQNIGSGYGGSGNITMVAFHTDGVVLPPPAPSPRRLAIIGDSITAGMGAAYNGPCTSGVYLNDYANTYGHAICANFSADCTTAAWSGIGVVCNYGSTCSPGEATMPFHFPYTLGGFTGATAPRMDFSAWQPDGILINLGTNDWGFNRGANATFVEWYTSTYVDFWYNLTHVYWNAPSTPVFLAVGSLTNDYAVALQDVVSRINTAGGNATFLNLMVDPNLPIGCAGHPSPSMHAAMAAEAIPIMGRVLGWD